MASLMDFHGIEEPFYDHYGLIPRPAHAVQIEKYLRLPKPGRETIFRLGAVDRPSGVGDQIIAFVVDRDHHMSFEKAGASIESDTEGSSCGRVDGASAEVGVGTINAAKNKAERTIRFYL